MEKLQAERVLKAVVDGVSDYAGIAQQAGVDPVELVAHAATIDHAIELMRGFYKFGHENMQPAGLPPPPNPYWVKAAPIDAQPPEYYAYEAVQRGNIDRERCLWICGQFGLDAEAAATAIDNVCMPWREANGWRTYVRAEPGGRQVLQDKPPVKLKRLLAGMLSALSQPSK